MFKSLQWRIAVPFIVLIVASMGALAVYLAEYARSAQIESLRSHLEKEARITAEAAVPALQGSGDALGLSRKLGIGIGARVTLIAADGSVLGDSEENPESMENHASRPEVVGALRAGFGESLRFSTTLGQQMMYVAVPVTDRGRTIGVARVALPLTMVEGIANRTTTTVLVAMALAALVAVVAAWRIARITTRPIRDLTLAVKEVASGGLGRRVGVPATDEAGDLARAFNDMSSELKRLVQAMSSERTRLATVLSGLADGVIMTDADRSVVLANRAAGIFFGFQPETVSSKPLLEVVQDHELDELLEAAIEAGQERVSQLDVGPTRRFVRAIAVPLVDATQRGALLLLQDLTTLRNLQTMRQELVGNISHDFMTPIAGIKALVETLQNGAIDERAVARDFLARIGGEVDRLAHMVSELTHLSRIERGAADLNIQVSDMNTMVEEAIARLRPLAQRQQVSLVARLADGAPAVAADRDRIGQAIVNLLHNAVKFNRPGGMVTVTVASDEDRVTVSVADTGCGISAEDLPHVFERFYRSDKARSGQGSGLGLAIVKHVVQAHCGVIYAESDEGKGSTFTMSLPAARNVVARPSRAT